MKSVNRSVLFLGTILLLPLFSAHTASANSSTPSTAAPISSSRALVPYVDKKCPALFQPAPPGSKPSYSAASAYPPHTIKVKTAFVDSSGNPIMKDVEVGSKEAADAASWLTIADFAPVYNDKMIKDMLEGGKKIHEEQRAVFEDMISRGQNRFLALPNSLTALDHLYQTMPNFKEALDVIKKSLAISLASGEPIRIPNIILLGDPGIGKTRFANAVAKALGTGFDFISMNSVTAGWVLSGAHVTWKGASLGRVAKLLIEKDYANPIVVVDELDKAAESEGQRSLTSLHQLWEKDTAKQFRDEFLGLDIDASHINWIATANELSGIPKPIRSRATVITVPKPDKEQMRSVIPSIIADNIAAHPKLPFLPTITEDVFLKLYSYSPREVSKLIEDAIGNAVLAGRRELQASDINPQALKDEKKRGIGFMAEGF